MNKTYHGWYIGGSIFSAVIAAAGLCLEWPVAYGLIPGVVGIIMAAVATVRFFKDKTDLTGFVATTIGFVYYQAYQANPVMLPSFTATLSVIELRDQLPGVVFGNLTTALLLLAYLGMDAWFGKPLTKLTARLDQLPRADVEGTLLLSFGVLFVVVSIPNVLFGGVVVGAFKNVLYQRLTWSEADTYSGFAVWGGELGGSVANLGLWATSLFLLWLYLLRSARRTVRIAMYLLAPLILLWSASVALQGSRTYLVAMGVATAIYILGSPRIGRKALAHLLWALPAMFLVVQTLTLFRGEGLAGISSAGLAEHVFEIQGNEGTPSQIDGFEYFRTELVAKEAMPNPLLGFVRGMLERPLEGLLMPVPRSLFPWKFEDQSGREFNLFFQNVRLHVASSETFLGASPGLIGRELIKYGLFGPLTLLFWFGLILALAHRLYAAGPASDFHRFFAGFLIAFVFAQARDFAPVWFIPFLPGAVVCAIVVYRARRRRWQPSSRQAVRRPAAAAVMTDPSTP